jgi:glycosyltransferase involved in cell wall biosynthesis
VSKKVKILLSTFNGENYLEEQLQSILKQDYENFELHIRDDGSKDKTREILQKYETMSERVFVTYGENIGVIAGFFSLIEKSYTSEPCYVALCDQDDVWKIDKISSALNLLRNYKNTPAMYCSNTTLVSGDLKFIGETDLVTKSPSINNAFIENIAIGCTIVINYEALKLLICDNNKKKIIMHDWWIYLVVSCFGEVIFDKNSKILYRQHSSNVVGANNNGLKKWIERYKKYTKNNIVKNIYEQMEEFYRVYGSLLQGDSKLLVEDFIKNRTFFKKFFYLISSKIYRQHLLDELFMKLIILFSKS